MADYRFSAQAISRSKGQSSVASAAYRAGTRLIDERTGEIHDYERKGGVTHSEVMTPEGTPEWMHDRAQLWNAIEAVERRKDAQLAREVQLSLPHELTNDQRQELVRSFVQEQFVNRGMVADVAIHAPSDKGDLRNHHSHIMLTMRDLTGDGFGKKNRDWNNPELLNTWREEWANHQNRALERHGHSSRVDHRSFEAQGIDREPSQHLGPVASDMERNGKASRIGDQNREIANDNTARAQNYIELVSVNDRLEKFDQWIDQKSREIDAAQDLKKLDLAQKHSRQQSRLESHLLDTYGTAKVTIQAEIKSVDKRLQAKGFRKVVRTVFGMKKADLKHREELAQTLKGIEKRENEKRGLLRRTQKLEVKKQAERQKARRDRATGAMQRRKNQLAAEKQNQRIANKPKRDSTVRSQKVQPQKSPDHIKPDFVEKALKEVKPINAPSLDDKKLTAGKHSLDEKRGDLERPWRRSISSERAERSWRRSDAPRRTRAPSPSGGGKDGKE